MTAISTLDPATTAPASALGSRLAPPFGSGWSRFGGPVPRGFWGNARLDSGRASGTLQLGAEPHPPGTPTTIGWFWAGWRRRISIAFPTLFLASVHCDDVFSSGGGTWVPRAFLTLQPVGGGGPIERSTVLSKGRTAAVALATPPSSLPASYDLTFSFNVRSSYAGTASPAGEVRATCRSLVSLYAFPTLEDELPKGAAEAAFELAAEGDLLDREELRRALADLGADLRAEAVESDEAALTAGLVPVAG